MKLIYELSSNRRKQAIIDSGVDPGLKQIIEIDEREITLELRRFIVETTTFSSWPPETIALKLWLRNFQAIKGETLVLDKTAQEITGLQALTLSYQSWRQALQDVEEYKSDRNKRLFLEFKEYKNKIAQDTNELNDFIDKEEYLSRREIEEKLRWIKNHFDFHEPKEFKGCEGYQELLDVLHYAKTLKENIKDNLTVMLKNEKDRIEQDKIRWIQDHGSEYLKRCLASGYDCQRQYVIERAALEYPGYTVDYNDTAGWKSRSGPSVAALNEADRVKGRVVWLTSAPSNFLPDQEPLDWTDQDETECEAVVIEEYLGSYDLIKRM